MAAPSRIGVVMSDNSFFRISTYNAIVSRANFWALAVVCNTARKKDYGLNRYGSQTTFGSDRSLDQSESCLIRNSRSLIHNGSFFNDGYAYLTQVAAILSKYMASMRRSMASDIDNSPLRPSYSSKSELRIV